MNFQITWLNSKQELSIIQTKQLINHCKADLKDSFFTMNSPLYKAIEDNSFCLDTGYGQHYFTIKEITI